MTLLYFLDLLGTAVFAVSGVWLACRKDMDLFGAMVLAFVTAVGGGTLRDLLLGAPVFWVGNHHYVTVILLATITALLVRRWHEQPRRQLLVADALGLAVFTVIGVTKAMSFGVPYTVAIMMGVLTGCGGGAIRDLLAGEVPLVLRKEIYALASMVGGVVYIVAERFLGVEGAMLLASLVIFAMRMVAVQKNVSLPKLVLPGADVR